MYTCLYRVYDVVYLLCFLGSDPVETDLSDRYEVVADCGAMSLGDCSFHHGWLLHRQVEYS